MTRRPARWERLLEAILPDDAAEEIVGDLLEEGGRRGGGLRASLLVLGLAVSVVGSFLLKGRLTEDGKLMGGLMGFWGDVRRALRGLRRSPGFAGAVMATLGIGMAAEVAVFVLLEGVVLRALPYEEPDRLVQVTHSAPGMGLEGFRLSLGSYVHYRRRVSGFEELGIYSAGEVDVVEDANPERVRSARVTPSLLRLLAAVPHTGRLFTEQDASPGAEPVVLLSHDLWTRRFSGSGQVVGSSLELDGVLHRVVGVLEPGFRLPDYAQELLIPLIVDAANPPYGGFTYTGVGGLRRGATLERVSAELAEAIDELPEVFPDDITPAGIESMRLAARVVPLRAAILGDVAGFVWMLWGAGFGVLLLAFTNVSTLFMARAKGRKSEASLRLALGASRSAMRRIFVLEGMATALGGCLLGVLLSAASLEAVAALGTGIPRLDQVGLGFEALVSALVLAALLGWILGGLEARWATAGGGALLTRTDLRAGGPPPVGGALVGLQVALSFTLLVGAGLLVGSFANLRQVDPGFRPDGALALRLDLPAARYGSPQEIARFHDALRDRLGALPGVQEVGAVGTMPLSDRAIRSPVVVEGVVAPPGTVPTAFVTLVASPGALEALGVPLLDGRYLETEDHRLRTGAVVVSKAMANQVWPDQDPLGRRIYIDPVDHEEWYRVVGVVGDVKLGSLREDARGVVYLPSVGVDDYAWWNLRSATVVVRGVSNSSLVTAMRAEVARLDPALVTDRLRSVEDIVASSDVEVQLFAQLLGVAAVVSLVLAGVGVFGVVSDAARGRVREIGIRMALGADRPSVIGLFVTRLARWSAIGLAVGTVSAALATRALEGLLFGVSRVHAGTYLGVAAILLATVLVAAAIPTVRAARRDLVRALHGT